MLILLSCHVLAAVKLSIKLNVLKLKNRGPCELSLKKRAIKCE